MTMPVSAVTGASGHLGRFAIEQLLARAVPPSDVVAVVRNRGKATSLASRGVQVRQADYSRPQTLGAALVGVNQLLLVSSSEFGQLAAQYSNVIMAARTAGVSRIAYTSMLNADDSTSPLAGGHRDTERVLREAGVPYTLLRNGYYTEVYTAVYTDPLGRYLQDGEILGAAGHGKIAAATRPDYAAAAAAALLLDEKENRIYELGSPAFGLPQLARAISEITGRKVTYHDLPAGEYAWALQRTGLDEATARFVVALDVSIARGDLETSSQDLARMLGRSATPLTEVARAAYDLFRVSTKRQSPDSSARATSAES
jgi:NAD(P)H dehydrogenase (quinone)